MPILAFNSYGDYLSRVLAIWEYLGDDFQVDSHDREWVQTLQDEYQETLNRLIALEQEMIVLKGKRAAQVNQVASFAVRLRAAILGKFGADSTQGRSIPNLRERHAGRPTKRAVSLKAHHAAKRDAKILAEAALLRAKHDGAKTEEAES